MMIDQTRYNGCVVLAVAGGLDGEGAAHLRLAVTKALAEQPRAIICDLTGLAGGTGGLNVFLVVADMMNQWPETAIAIACPHRRLVERLSRIRIDTRIPIRHSVDQAIADLGHRPMIMMELLHLLPGGNAAGLARHFVADACRQWDASPFLADALIVVSELVDNALQHGDGEPLDVRVSLSRLGLRISVRDTAWSSPQPTHQTGQISGIRILAHLSKSWGVLPTQTGGKIVWCLLRHPDDPRRGRVMSIPRSDDRVG
jgi:anti-sigma regulatory factor (Ser/Thr protein kinase)/anti-anti-sigma regulatory factor